jgi:putative ABC transport system permease protein
MRSSLTLIGVVLGVLSINVMFSLVGGIRGAIDEIFEFVGLDGVVFVVPEQVPANERNAYTSASKGVSIADARALMEAGVDVIAVPLTTFKRQVKKPGGELVQVEFTGTQGGFLDMRNLGLREGRSLTWADEVGETNAAVVGSNIAKALFGSEDPMGQHVSVGDIQLEVVGILDSMKLPPGVHMGGLDVEGNAIYIPASTAQRYFNGIETPVALAIRVNDHGRLSEIVTQVETIMTRRHRGVMDFRVDNVAEELLREKEQIDKMLVNWNVVLGCIAGAALLVGGIGILSVMLIALQERLFEVGLRKAVGAEDREVLVQFLVESVVLCVAGAAIGTSVAAAMVGALNLIIARLSQEQFLSRLELSAGGLGLSCGFAVLIGLVFGFYPAWLASRMEPVEALRAS